MRKMSAIPAQRLGLADRGILRDGMKADLVLFDPDRVQAKATFDQPKQFPEGIDYVVVNGQLVIDNGVHTGAFPGRALRSQSLRKVPRPAESPKQPVEFSPSSQRPRTNR